MESIYNVTLVIFIVIILLSRYINNEAIKKLSMEKKAELFDAFSNFGILSIIPLFIIMAGAYFVINNVEDNKLIYLLIFVILIAIYAVGIQVYIYKKLTKLEYPMSYIKHYILSVFVRFAGLIVLGSPIILEFLYVYE